MKLSASYDYGNIFDLQAVPFDICLPKVDQWPASHIKFTVTSSSNITAGAYSSTAKAEQNKTLECKLGVEKYEKIDQPANHPDVVGEAQIGLIEI